MPEYRLNHTPGEENTDPRKDSTEEAPFESDTQKLVRRHLEDKDHVITEEEIASIRVGMTPLNPTTPDEEVDEKAEKLLGGKKEDSTGAAEDRVTPWDTLND